MKNLIDSLLGHTALVGMTYLDTQEQMTRQEQFIGEITDAKKDCIVVTLPDKSERLLPAMFIHRAPRGEYECLTTGEKVNDPDFLLALLIKDSGEPNVPPYWSFDSAPLTAPRAPRHWNLTPHHDPDYLKSVINTERENYFGKRVLVGLTYYRDEDSGEEFIEQKQIHGEIIRISYKEGIVIALENGEEYKLPPDLPSLEPAPPGEYTLRSTGEVIMDPDFVTNWIVNKPPSE